jgi:excisionase family DNA binding protein
VQGTKAGWRLAVKERREAEGNDMAVARNDNLLTPAEVAALFKVDPKTVTRWAQAGKISSLRTLGGHRRFQASQIHALLDASE